MKGMDDDLFPERAFLTLSFEVSEAAILQPTPHFIRMVFARPGRGTERALLRRLIAMCCSRFQIKSGDQEGAMVCDP